MLVTSRQRFTLPGLFAKNLDSLPPDDARNLLVRIAPRLALSPIPSTNILSLSKEGEGLGVGASFADAIAKLCGYLPLALRLAGSALAERVDLSPADYLRRLRNAQTKFPEVDASLNLSYELIGEELQKLWRLLAVFPDTFDKSAAAAVWQLDADAAHDRLGELVRYSLVDYLPSPGRRGAGGEVELLSRYRLHDLARVFADKRLSDAERADGLQHHAEHYLSVAAAADEHYRKGGDSIRQGLSLFDLEWLNIQAGQAWAAAPSAQDDVAANLCNYYAGQWNVLNLRLHARDQIRWLEAALAAARHLQNRQAEGVHLGNLGLAYAALGEPRKAIEFYEQHRAIAREIGDRRGEGAALGNLGSAYYSLGDARKAIEFYEQRLVIAREIGDRRGEGAALGNLGLAYADLGDARKAIEFYEQALVIAREIGDRRGEGNALWNKAITLDKLGERAQAIANAEAAHMIFEAIESPYAERVQKQLAAWRGATATTDDTADKRT